MNNPFKIYTKTAHWAKADKIRVKTGELPKKVFNFIGVHQLTKDNAYGLSYPMCMVNEKGERPIQENVVFPTFFEAAQYALRQACVRNLFVVNCDK